MRIDDTREIRAGFVELVGKVAWYVPGIIQRNADNLGALNVSQNRIQRIAWFEHAKGGTGFDECRERQTQTFVTTVGDDNVCRFHLVQAGQTLA